MPKNLLLEAQPKVQLPPQSPVPVVEAIPEAKADSDSK